MADATRSDLLTRKRREAVETFLASMVKSSRTIILYAHGHTLIPQMVERVRGLLLAAVGEEPNIQLDVKAKQVLFEEEPLTENSDVVSFAVSLHTLGIGNVILTSRVSTDGLEQLMRLLTWKPDEKRSLSDLQKAVQDVRIDGLQLISIMSFVVTGEQEESVARPGQLSEEELQALERADTLPDFLHILLRRNELLTSREAEQLSAVFDQALAGELAVEDFEAQMPWALYDPRVRARWDAFRAELSGRTKWTRSLLVSALALTDKAERAALAEHHTHDASASAEHALTAVHALLDKPVGERQPRFALQAYKRLLTDMARGGRLGPLLAEYRLWKERGADPQWGSYLSALQPDVEHMLATPAVASAAVGRLAENLERANVLSELRDFLQSCGPGVMPLLVDEMRRVSDKAAQKGLGSMLAQLARHLGAGALAEALKDEDYFVVLQALAVIDEVGGPNLPDRAAPLIVHGHAKVRAAAIRVLGKAGGPKSAVALAAAISSGAHPEEARLAAQTLSLIVNAGADRLLLDAYQANDSYETRVAVAISLGRCPTPEVEAFLLSITKQTFVEWLKGLLGRFTGKPKDLREAALHSLAEVRKDLHGKKG
ncbi:HEAT repeat domain-containing protein [bacterium]|nr:MAG: HEAT repeat domain-containing protein [bacterium]